MTNLPKNSDVNADNYLDMQEILHKKQALFVDKIPIMLLAIFVCLLFWILDSYLHVHVFKHNDDFLEALFPHEIGELWMRSIVCILILSIAVIARRTINNTKKSTQQINAIFENTHDAYMAVDSSWNVIYVNNVAEQFLSTSRNDILGGNIWDLFPEAASTFYKPLSKSMREQEPCICRGFYSAVGKWLELHSYPNKDYMSFYFHDISNRISLEESNKKLKAMLANASDAVISINDQGIIEQYNSAAEIIFGYKAHEAIGQNIKIIVPEPHASEHDAYISKYLHRGTSNLVNAGARELLARRNDGSTFPAELAISDMIVNDKRYFIGIIRDITERRQTQNALEYLSSYDALTGLPNRTLFNDRLKHTITDAKRKKNKFALMFIDLDEFKKINDTLGHAAGDELLKIFANRLKLSTRASDTIARLGGDEFIVILNDICENENAEAMSKKIIQSMAEPVTLNMNNLVITTSIGISIYPDHGENESDLLINADIAMYKAKELGRNNYQVYSPNMAKHNLKNIKLEHDLGDALRKNQFELFYQPQINLSSGNVVGLEALIRWNHPDRGMVSPAEFIPLLENSGLILPVGEWVIREACRQNAKWRDTSLGNMRIAVNLSAMQFRQKELTGIISDILTETSLEAKYLELEITEGLLVEDIESTFVILNSLHELGIHLSLDDFGTGYSSMNYLQRFPLKTLKIDQSFVQEISTNNDDAVITTAMIELAHRLGLTVIAEGVEDEKQLIFLRAHGCDEVQGYYFCKPMPVDQITDWLHEFKKPLAASKNTGTAS